MCPWLVFALLFVPSALQCQLHLNWARGLPNGQSAGHALDVDQQGNTYSFGTFTGATDFDPGPGTYYLTNTTSYSDLFISKLNAAGNFVWAKQLINHAGGGDVPEEIYIDGLGNLYIAGTFYDSIDFDPGPGVAMQTATFNAGFVCKYDTSGQLIWATSFNNHPSTEVHSLTMDADGNLIVVGNYVGVGDFDMGPGIVTLPYVSLGDAFVLKLTPSGALVWAESLNGADMDRIVSVATDPHGNICMMGEFKGILDMDPGPGYFPLAAVPGTIGPTTDIFVVKLRKHGAFVWAYSMGSSLNDEAHDILAGPSGEVYTTGGFFQSVDFDPGPGSTYLLSQGYIDAFVQKLDSNGQLIWAKSIGGINYDRGYRIIQDQAGGIVYYGGYRFGMDLDPGPGIFNVTAPSYGVFFSKLSPTGNFVWGAGFAPNSNNMYPGGIDFNPLGQVHINGSHRNTVDFDPGPGVTNLSSIGDSFFACKYQPCNSYTTSTISATACGSYAAPNGQILTQSGSYLVMIENGEGCDSLITINLTVRNNTTSSIFPYACGNYVAPDGQTYTTSGTYIATIPNHVGCDSVITILLNLHPNTASTIYPTVCGSYVAPDGQLHLASGTFVNVIPNHFGCDSTITVNLTVNQATAGTISPTVCDTYAAPNGQIYTASGNYIATIANSVGCDSVIAIDLEVLHSSNASISPLACDTYTAIDGQIYTSSGIYTATIPNSVGCDSVITITLTVDHPSADTIDPIACGSYVAPDGAVYENSGTYNAIISNPGTCDSTITIHLTITHLDTTVIQSGLTLTAMQAGAQYQWLDCNNGNAAIPGATGQSFAPNASGYYAVALTQGNCSDTSNCMGVTVLGLADIAERALMVFPNPTDGWIHVLSPSLGTLEVIDAMGKVVLATEIKQSESALDLSCLAAGVYALRLNGRMQVRIQLVKS